MGMPLSRENDIKGWGHGVSREGMDCKPKNLQFAEK